MIKIGHPDINYRDLFHLRKLKKSGWLAGRGPITSELERDLSKYSETPYVTVVSSASIGLYMSLVALGVKNGDEVIVADYTFPASGHSVLMTGARPVFADVLESDGTIDWKKIEPLITQKTRAIIAVDVGGMPADYSELVDLKNKHSLFLIQDSACSIGAKYNSQPIGSQGDICVFSFHGKKVITGGEGGAILTTNKEIHESIKTLVSFGVEDAFIRQSSSTENIPQFVNFGFNFRLSDLSSSLILDQLKRIDKILSTREILAMNYYDLFSQSSNIQLATLTNAKKSSWQSFYITVDNKVTRNKLITTLKANGVQATIGTFASHIQPVYKSNNLCPVSQALFERQLSLPIHTKITFKTQKKIVEIIENAII